MDSSGKSYFGALTGIRAVAAGMVFLHHYYRFGNGLAPAFINELHVGVTVFFVLSGFLIGYRYADSVEFSGKWLGSYLLNRFARILPVYFFLTTLLFLVYCRHGCGEELFFLYFLNLTLLKGFFQHLLFTGIPQSWSLAVEAFFYLVAPFLFVLYRKSAWSWFWVPPAFAGAGLLLVWLMQGSAFYGFFGSNKFMLSYTFFGRCTEFMVGMGLALSLKRTGIGQEPSGNRLLTYGGLTGVLAVVAVLAFLRGSYQYGIEHPAGILLNNVLLPFIIAGFFRGLVTEDTFIRKILQSRVLQIAGKSSYVFYLIHYGPLRVLLQHFVPVSGIFLFLLLQFIAVVLHYTVEEPAGKWIRSYGLRVKLLASA